jgi:hypothetical protein
MLVHEYRCPIHGLVREDSTGTWGDLRTRCPMSDKAGHPCHERLHITRVQSNVVQMQDYLQRIR